MAAYKDTLAAFERNKKDKEVKGMPDGPKEDRAEMKAIAMMAKPKGKPKAKGR